MSNLTVRRLTDKKTVVVSTSDTDKVSVQKMDSAARKTLPGARIIGFSHSGKAAIRFYTASKK